MNSIILTVESSSIKLGFFSPVASGEANTCANVGGAVEVFRDQIGETFNFRTLVGQGTVDVRVNGDTVEIDGSGGGGGGDVTGPGSSTDSAAALWDGASGTVIKNSNVTIDGSGNVSTPGTVDGRDLSADGAVLDSHVASVANPHVVTTAQIGAIPTTQKGTPNGVAELDGAGDVPVAQIPSTIAREADLQAHIADNANPHSVTAAQVGAATPQWNADELQGLPVSVQAPTPGQGLVWDGLQWEPQTPAGAGNVVGPGAANDREIAVFDGGPTLLDNATATISNTGNLVVAGTVTGAGIALGAHAADHEIGGGQVLTAQNLGSGAAAQGRLLETDGAGALRLAPVIAPTNGQQLTWNAAASRWEPANPRGSMGELFLQAEPSGNSGDRRVRAVGSTGSWRFNLWVPSDFGSLISMGLRCRALVTVVGVNIDRTSQYGAPGAVWPEHNSSDTTSTFSFTIDEETEMDIAALFPDLGPNDHGGIFVNHLGIGTTIEYLGIRIVYNRA